VLTGQVEFQRRQLADAECGFAHEQERLTVDVVGIRQAFLKYFVRYFVSCGRQRSGKISGLLDSVGGADEHVRMGLYDALFVETSDLLPPKIFASRDEI
jgi:hypothetical protein